MVVAVVCCCGLSLLLFVVVCWLCINDAVRFGAADCAVLLVGCIWLVVACCVLLLASVRRVLLWCVLSMRCVLFAV